MLSNGLISYDQLESSLDNSIIIKEKVKESFLNNGIIVATDGFDDPIVLYDPNKAATRLFFPGSTIKPFILDAYLLSYSENRVTACTGDVTVGSSVLRCNNGNPHGYMNIRDAIAKSCNSMFYRISLTLTGQYIWNRINILLRENAQCKLASVSRFNAPDTMAIGTGQFFFEISPLYWCAIHASLVNEGMIKFAGLTYYDLFFKYRSRYIVLDCMRYTSINGTAKKSFEDYDNLILSKTGSRGLKEGGAHTWFVCNININNYWITFLFCNPNGVEGGVSCAPIARALLDNYLLIVANHFDTKRSRR